MSESDAGRPPVTAQVLETLVERVKERVYATITMLAVLVGLAQNTHTRYSTATVFIACTALGLWLATLVADFQAHRVVHQRLPDRAELRHLLYVTSPLLSSAAGPLVMIVLSAFGLFHLSTALWIAVGVDIASLAAWGFVGGRRMGSGVVPSIVAAVVDAAIGLGVVMVKVVAGH
ncbi:hypothetical protein STRCI_004659 [Streptomyces cinnabarinus]|uniref:Integral membrane protein n=1 Tax=Streptomyces cinnabarinus TaxID=67287 RepID=A0ABY7KIV8_9ACTN|nr:hypothetical protein [Streptomyces cinnabarinus]WAZ23322.1 hypothetical protein STRCI_004659 [Streptomyces cinnabarinus]